VRARSFGAMPPRIGLWERPTRPDGRHLDGCWMAITHTAHDLAPYLAIHPWSRDAGEWGDLGTMTGQMPSCRCRRGGLSINNRALGAPKTRARRRLRVVSRTCVALQSGAAERAGHHWWRSHPHRSGEDVRPPGCPPAGDLEASSWRRLPVLFKAWRKPG
jgi:hypothetical protein